jgi:hypothetical protein
MFLTGWRESNIAVAHPHQPHPRRVQVFRQVKSRPWERVALPKPVNAVLILSRYTTQRCDARVQMNLSRLITGLLGVSHEREG